MNPLISNLISTNLMLSTPLPSCSSANTSSLGIPVFQIMYLYIIIAISLLIQHHRLIRITFPLTVNYVLVVICSWMQTHTDPEKDLPVLSLLSGQVIISLPLLPTSFDYDVIWDVFAASLPHKIGLFCCTRTIVLATTFWAMIRHFLWGIIMIICFTSCLLF